MSIDLHYFANRIAGLEDEKRCLSEQIAEEYQVAASKGFNAKALRKAIKITRMDADKRAKHESEQSDIETYLANLEGVRIREAAE